jgi:hypothetical protein
MTGRYLISTLILWAFISCSDSQSEGKPDDWRQVYINQEKSRITTTKKFYNYRLSRYSLNSSSSGFVTFNEKDQKLSIGNTHFYVYDKDGRLIAEEFCMRTCETPGRIIYIYDSLNRLEMEKYVVSDDKEWITAKYFYDDNNLLIRKTNGSDKFPAIELYTYDQYNRIVTIKRDEYNHNLDSILQTLDSIFYAQNGSIDKRKKYRTGKDFLTISRFTYDDTLLVSQTDTTITTLIDYLPHPGSAHSAYYFRTDYKYNSAGKIIEKITYQPDYKTPTFKVTYEYE